MVTPSRRAPSPCNGFVQILRAATPSSKLLFLCSPGNPTGKSVPASVVRDIVAGGFDGIIVVDEAYVDFSGKESACSLIDELDRVVVLQTLSKAFGMAAIRCVFQPVAVACVCSRVVGWEEAGKPLF